MPGRLYAPIGLYKENTSISRVILGHEISNMKQKIKNLSSTIFNKYMKITRAKYLGLGPCQPRDQFTHR